MEQRVCGLSARSHGCPSESRPAIVYCIPEGTAEGPITAAIGQLESMRGENLDLGKLTLTQLVQRCWKNLDAAMCLLRDEVVHRLSEWLKFLLGHKEAWEKQQFELA